MAQGASSSVVLVVTGTDDPTADAVIDELHRLNAPVLRVDTGDFPSRLNFRATGRKGNWVGRLWTDDGKVDLADIRAIYYRRPTRFRFPPEFSDGDAVFAAAEARLGLGGVLGSLDTRWVNNPFRIAVAEYKPLQLRVAARAGLATPRTLVTNEHAAAIEFAAEVDGPVVCKTLSSLALSEGGDMRITYTTEVDPSHIDPKQWAGTAHLLQEWIPKVWDARVTMVGNQPIAVAIKAESESGRADWRADYNHLNYERIVPPSEITAGMIQYLREFDLLYGAFDFVVTPNGDWVMLECNSAGQWLWLQHETEAPIAVALAGLLVDGPQE